MIEIKNVSQSYVKGNKVIENMNLKIDDGIVFGFIGPNGAGKTTLYQANTGLKALPRVNVDECDGLFKG